MSSFLCAVNNWWMVNPLYHLTSSPCTLIKTLPRYLEQYVSLLLLLTVLKCCWSGNGQAHVSWAGTTGHLAIMAEQPPVCLWRDTHVTLSLFHTVFLTQSFSQCCCLAANSSILGLYHLFTSGTGPSLTLPKESDQEGGVVYLAKPLKNTVCESDIETKYVHDVHSYW